MLEQGRRFKELHESIVRQSRYSKVNQRPWDLFSLKNGGISSLLEESKFEERNQSIFVKPPDDEIEDVAQQFESRGLTK